MEDFNVQEPIVQKPIGNDYGIMQEPQVDQKPMTFGEKLVGLTFNPSNDDKVGKAKRLCADLADLLNEEESNSIVGLKRILFDHAITEILNAQMNCVKVLTLKY